MQSALLALVRHIIGDMFACSRPPENRMGHALHTAMSRVSWRLALYFSVVGFEKGVLVPLPSCSPTPLSLQRIPDTSHHQGADG